MATSRPFAYNTGVTITGTIQVGNLSIGTPTSGFTNNPQYWNGPDEELGYVIARPVSGNTQPSPVFNSSPGSPMTWSSVYNATDISLSNVNQTATQVFAYTESVLSNTLINGNDKVMFSIYFNSTQPLVGVGGRYIGIGTRLMNYQGPFNGNPGNDDKSLGFSDDGKYYYNGSVQVSGLPTWTSEDIVDIAISAGGTSKIWLRVNNGYWNGNVLNNPETGVGGLGISGITSYYPAVCPGIYGNMTILNTGYQTPNNFIRLGTNVNSSVGFNRTSGFTDGSFITLAEYISRKYNTPQTFATATDASTWLTNNGFWNSYSSVTPTPTATLGITPTPSVTPTLTPTPTSTPASGASGNFNVTISQVGPDVVWSGSGSFNLAALTSAGPGSIGGGYNSGQAVWAIGPNVAVDTYSGTITYPFIFGTSAVGVTSNAGSTFGILPGGSGRLLYVPSGYVSNTNISGSSTYANKTIAEAGLTTGTYTWSWGSGGNTSTLVMTISS
jgi:hypothetical protein